MNLILLFDSDFSDDTRARLSDKRAEHVRTVLRSVVGDTIAVGRLNGPTGSARITAISDDEIMLEIEKWNDTPEYRPGLHVVCALPRPQLLRRVLRICGMMGVRRLDLIRANRVEKSYFESPLLEPDAYTPYLLEGLSQGRYTCLPSVGVHHRFKPFWEDVLPAEKHFTRAIKILAHGDTARRITDLCIQRGSSVILVIGPEGGWVPFEVELMTTAGCNAVLLGPWVLRVDAAMVAALAQLEACAARGDT